MSRERQKANIGGEMDMKPFVNFMIILASALIICVEFSKIAFIDLKLPEGRGSTTIRSDKTPPTEDKDDKLLLTAIVTDSVVTLGAKGGFMPSMYYREYHRYVDKNDGVEVTVQYKAGEVVKNPQSGRELTVYERLDIFLYCVDSIGNIVDAMYTREGDLLTTSAGVPAEQANTGDTVFTVTNPRRMIIVSNPAMFQKRHLSAYDELKNRLMKVKERYPDAEDGQDIIIAAENEVMYDKIVQLMDTSREAGYLNISIAKLRA